MMRPSAGLAVRRPYRGVDDDLLVNAGMRSMAPLEAQVGGTKVGDAGHLVVLDVETKHLCSPTMI